jgi:hypothetical protein
MQQVLRLHSSMPSLTFSPAAERLYAAVMLAYPKMENAADHNSSPAIYIGL